MKAIVQEGEQLRYAEVATPEPGPGEVRVRIAATAANRADLMQRAGKYPPPPGASEILGLECSGVIDQVGEGVDPTRLGQQVCALLAGGGYAEYCVCPAGHALPLPAGLSLTEAAGVPEVFATAWLNLRLEGELTEGERVLVHAGASGVGTSAIQLCVAWGNPVFATVRTPSKVERCRALGAEVTSEPLWSKAVREWGGADVILDPVGGGYLERNIHVLNSRGRLVNIGLMGGVEGTLPMGRLLVQRLSLRGSVLRSRSNQEKDRVMRGLAEEVWPLLASKQVYPVIDRTLCLTEAEKAHQIMRDNRNIGKLILTVPD